MTEVRTPNQTDRSSLPELIAGHEGVAFVATLRGTPGRDVLDTALGALRNLQHDRSRTSGILTHIPDAILRDEFGADLPPAGAYALGFAFHTDLAHEQNLIAEISEREGFTVFAWRPIAVNDTMVEAEAEHDLPIFQQVILQPKAALDHLEFDAALYRIRKRVEAQSSVYFASLSRTTVVYKGLVPAPRLALFYEDLAHPRFFTEIAIVHSSEGRHYSTWCKAQPHRIIAHDGHVHSERVNRTWLRSRLQLMDSDLLDGAGEVIRRSHLIEGALDELIELLHRGGRTLTHALRLVLPEQWGRTMSRAEQDFSDYSAMVMEPWEGSGVTCFADGNLVGAILDRHGSRSGRYWVTEAGLVIFASETGVVDLDPSTITKKGRLAPGEIIAVDTITGNVLPSDAIRAALAATHPYGEWLNERIMGIAAAASPTLEVPTTIDPAYHVKDESRAVAHELARGNDLEDSGAVSRQLTFFDRFRSVRSQLTTPYIDAVAMSARPQLFIGAQSDILVDGPAHARKVVLAGAAMSTAELAGLHEHLRVVEIDGTYPLQAGNYVAGTLATALERVRMQVDQAIADQAEVIVLSNRGVINGVSAPVPSLLLVGTAHQRLFSTGKRARASLIIDAGDALAPIEVVQLIAAGAQAVVPFHGEAVAGVARSRTYFSRLNSKVYQRLLRTGVAAYAAYQGSRRFHIVGLEPELVDEIFQGVPRALGTFGLDQLGRQISGAHTMLTPLQELLVPHRGNPILLSSVQPSEELVKQLSPRDFLVVTDTRKGVNLNSLTDANEVLLVPPAHQDTVSAAGLHTFINELRLVNPTVRIRVRVGADLSTDWTALEAISAGADVINLVDAEYEWVFGLLSLRQSAVVEQAQIAVAGGLVGARDIFIAAALGAREFLLGSEADVPAIVAELRELLANAGVHSLAELTGRIDLLDWEAAIEQWRSVGIDLRAVGPREHQQELSTTVPTIEDPLDETLTLLARQALDDSTPVRINAFVANTDVAVGAQLAGEIARRHGPGGLAPDSIRIVLTGSSGASLGAYAAPGLSIIVQGEAGDLVGKGLSGGRVAARPESSSGFAPQENVIAGSAVGYGAHLGGIYLAGEVGERLGAHNWGATIVCEGAGDAAGYRMHAGTIAILGKTGVNLGAGMEGGIIYALDLDPDRLHDAGAHSRLVTSRLTEHDLRELTAVIAEHVEMTNSRIGTMMLADPDQLESRFTKISFDGE